MDPTHLATTTELEESETLVSYFVPTLRILYSGDEGVVARLPAVLQEGDTLLGRVPTGPGRIGLPHDRRVSRDHCRIGVITEDGIRAQLTDMSSRNGTRLNGEPITETVELKDGGMIRIGNSFLIYRLEPARQPQVTSTRLVGVSPAIKALRRNVALFAPSAATVLVVGESGTGKELTARALHRSSPRKGPFIAVNCGAIPEALAESQFFGHTAGSFTGAITDHDGFFRSANGGTLFLDEIAELPATVQPKLLRALEEREVTPVGSTKTFPFDVRIIAASHLDLEAQAERNDFRAPLYARLAEVTLETPPLRDRKEDILPLVLHHMKEPLPHLAPRLVDALLRHNWPFNVRELVKMTTELGIRGKGLKVLDVDLVARRLGVQSSSVALREDSQPGPAREVTLELEAVAASIDQSGIPTRDELIELLRRHHGNISHLANATGRSRRQVHRWLTRYTLSAEDYRP